MIHVKRPADPIDLARFWATQPLRWVPMRAAQALQVQALQGTSGAIYDDARLVALAGLYPWEGDEVVWFAVAGDVTDCRRLAPVFSTLRRHLRAEARFRPRIIAEIAVGNTIGERLATGLGFAPEAQPRGKNFRVWTLTGG